MENIELMTAEEALRQTETFKVIKDKISTEKQWSLIVEKVTEAVENGYQYCILTDHYDLFRENNDKLHRLGYTWQINDNMKLQINW